MAKKSMIAREKKREKLVAKFESRRNELKVLIKSSQDFDVIMDAQAKLRKLPINSSPVRHSTRCQQCGRPHAVYRKFKLCRICLRQQLMTGNVTGGRKSSW
ncbi:MAG: 30S ribosomal protein S14 [Proteobacteria bacterium]|nr:30S ribosomal protein S14 [Pseudomonadota bacterium]